MLRTNDCTKKPDSDLKTSHSSEIRIGMLLPGELMFWPWYTLIGSVITLAVAFTVRALSPEKVAEPVAVEHERS